jgi:hypothetical protein
MVVKRLAFEPEIPTGPESADRKSAQGGCVHFRFGGPLRWRHDGGRVQGVASPAPDDAGSSGGSPLRQRSAGSGVGGWRANGRAVHPAVRVVGLAAAGSPETTAEAGGQPQMKNPAEAGCRSIGSLSCRAGCAEDHRGPEVARARRQPKPKSGPLCQPVASKRCDWLAGSCVAGGRTDLAIANSRSRNGFGVALASRLESVGLFASFPRWSGNPT